MTFYHSIDDKKRKPYREKINHSIPNLNNSLIDRPYVNTKPKLARIQYESAKENI